MAAMLAAKLGQPHGNVGPVYSVQLRVYSVQSSPEAEHPASGPPSPGASLGELWDDSSSDKTSRSKFMAIS